MKKRDMLKHLPGAELLAAQLLREVTGKVPLVLLAGWGRKHGPKFFVKQYDLQQGKYITVHSGNVPTKGYRTVRIEA